MPSNKARYLLLTLPLMAILQGGAQVRPSAAAPVDGAGQINFLSIVVDEETAAADTRLRKFLEKAVADRFRSRVRAIGRCGSNSRRCRMAT